MQSQGKRQSIATPVSQEVKKFPVQLIPRQPPLEGAASPRRPSRASRDDDRKRGGSATACDTGVPSPGDGSLPGALEGSPEPEQARDPAQTRCLRDEGSSTNASSAAAGAGAARGAARPPVPRRRCGS